MKPFKIAAIRTQPILTASTLEHIVTPEQVQCCSEIRRKKKLTLRYRNMKFSRKDLPFRKAPEKMWLSAISHSVSITFIENIHTSANSWCWCEKDKDKQIGLYLPQIWCRWVCLWCCPCSRCCWAPPRQGRTCVFHSHHQSSLFGLLSPWYSWSDCSEKVLSAMNLNTVLLREKFPLDRQI